MAGYAFEMLSRLRDIYQLRLHNTANNTMLYNQLSTIQPGNTGVLPI